MADYYTECSCEYEFPKEKAKKVEETLAAVVDKLEQSEGHVGFESDIINDQLVWIREDENADPQHIAEVIAALQDATEDDKPFIIVWANTCSKPTSDAYGGGACVVARGEEMFWVIPEQIAEKRVAEILEKREQQKK